MRKEPSKATLRKYGLSLEEWVAMAEEQDWKCAICGKEPETGRLCVDHSHFKGWSNLKPEIKKTYVRGLLCWVCNKFIVGRGVTIEKLENAVMYLVKFEERLATLSEKQAD